MKTLSVKQQELISEFSISIERDSATGSYLYLIEGVYYQQKGCNSEIEAFEAGIGKALENEKRNK